MSKPKIHIKVFFPYEHTLCGDPKAKIFNIWNDRATCKRCLKIYKTYYENILREFSKYES